MNEIKIEGWMLIPQPILPKLKKFEELESDYHGYTYILEWGNMESDMVKIGSTRNLYQRMLGLKQSAKYGDVTLGTLAISKQCTNYHENEVLLHNFFKEYRVEGTELFDIDFCEAMEMLPKLEFIDDSARKIAHEENTTEMFKKILLGDTVISENDKEKIALDLAERIMDDPETFMKWLINKRDQYDALVAMWSETLKSVR